MSPTRSIAHARLALAGALALAAALPAQALSSAQGLFDNAFVFSVGACVPGTTSVPT